MSFFGALKSVVYEALINSEMDLVARILYPAAIIQENPGIFDRLCQCIDSNGGHIKHLV